MALLLGAFMALGSCWPGAGWSEPAGAVAYAAAPQPFPQVIPSEQFAALAAERLEERLKSSGETRRHELKLLNAPPSMALPEGEVDCRVQFPQVINYGVSIPIRMEVYLNGKLYRTAVCYYKVIAYEKVLLVTHDIGVNHPFTAADLRLEGREVEAAAMGYFHDPREVIGKVPSRLLRMGQVLRTNMVKMPVVVTPWSPVFIVVDMKGIQARAEGTAMQEGRVGDYIKVKARSGKYLRAKVIDAQTVKVE